MANARAWKDAVVGELLFDFSDDEDEAGDGEGNEVLRAPVVSAADRVPEDDAAGGVDGSAAADTPLSPCSSVGSSGRSDWECALRRPATGSVCAIGTLVLRPSLAVRRRWWCCRESSRTSRWWLEVLEIGGLLTAGEGTERGTGVTPSAKTALRGRVPPVDDRDRCEDCDCERCRLDVRDDEEGGRPAAADDTASVARPVELSGWLLVPAAAAPEADTCE